MTGFAQTKWRKPAEDQDLMTLMKLKLNLLVADLSRWFGVSDDSLVSKTVKFWIDTLAIHLTNLIVWLPREIIKVTMPSCFKRYPNTTCILDCAETKLATWSQSFHWPFAHPVTFTSTDQSFIGCMHSVITTGTCYHTTTQRKQKRKQTNVHGDTHTHTHTHKVTRTGTSNYIKFNLLSSSDNMERFAFHRSLYTSVKKSLNKYCTL